MVENLSKSKLKHFLAGRKSFGSKPVIDGDESKMKQLAVSIVTAKEQRRQENTK